MGTEGRDSGNDFWVPGRFLFNCLDFKITLVFKYRIYLGIRLMHNNRFEIKLCTIKILNLVLKDEKEIMFAKQAHELISSIYGRKIKKRSFSYSIYWRPFDIAILITRLTTSKLNC